MADDVSQIRLFFEIVKAGNLSAAARSLNSSKAAMSRALRALETRLGVVLVARTSRSFQLTEEGRRFYDRCERIIDDIADAEAEVSIRGETIKGKMRVGAPMEIGRRLIAPLIGAFTARYPQVEVHLKLTDSGVSVVDASLDISLRVGLPESSSLIAKRILTTKRIVCAAPSYLNRMGTPRHPSELSKHDCIRLVRGRRNLDRWIFQENGRKFDLQVTGSLTSTSGEVVHDWLRAGRGLALKASWDLREDLANGAVVQCLEEFWCDEISLFAVYPARTRHSPRVSAFLKHMYFHLPRVASPEKDERDAISGPPSAEE